jgi:hypothetical protein
MKLNKTGKAMAAIALGTGLLAGAVGGAFLFSTHTTTEIPYEVIKEIEVIKQINNTVEVPFEVEVIKNVTVEVPVDNENLQLVLDEIYDNDGSVEYITDDLDDDELDQMIDRIIFVNEIKDLAAVEVESEFEDLIDNEVFAFNGTDVTFDEDDVERVRVQDDDDEITASDIDYEDGDADVEVFVNFEQDDVDYKARFIVEFKEGEVDDIDLESVVLRV